MAMISVVVALMVPVSLQAGMFGWLGKKDGDVNPEGPSTNGIKRLHLTLADKTAEKELLQLNDVKRILLQERQVLLLIIGEKQRDLTNFDEAFNKNFGIKKDRNYRYDAKSMTIFEETDKGGATTNTPGRAVEPKLFKKLETEAESRKFASLAAAKQITQDDLVVLLRLTREKEAASERVDNALKEKFSMSRDRNYWYDNKTLRLYEIVKASPKGAIQ